MERTVKFPKSQRFVLGQRLNQLLLSFYDSLIEATKGKKKLPCLKKADIDLEKFRVEF